MCSAFYINTFESIKGEEKMKKKVLSMMLVAAMGASMLVGCGGKDSGNAGTEGGSANSGADANKTITIWVADNVVDFTNEQVEAFKTANPEYADYEVVIQPVGEGDAAGNMITDVVGGADIYGFAQDQLARLVSAGALMPVVDADEVKSNNVEGSVTAATVGDTLYAFPMTADNGYFLYYDKSVVTDPSSLDAIIADCEANGKTFYMDLAAWWQTAFFFGTGCELTYETDVDGNFTACNVSYATEEGVAALKAMINMHKSAAYVKNSDASNIPDAGAFVCGTWAVGQVKEAFGDNYAAVKLPTFEVDGTSYQMAGFSGYKLIGVKPQEDADKLAACQALAKYLTSEEVQLARYNAVGWGPSNKVALEDEAVKADEALAAMKDQEQYCTAQGQYPGDYWSAGDALGDSVNAGEFDDYTDEQLMEVLVNFEESVQASVQ